MNPALLTLVVVTLDGFILPIVPFFPLRLWMLIPVAATTVNPVAVILAASIGTGLGALPLYGISYEAAETAAVERWLRRRWVRRLLVFLEGKMFLAVIVFALLPLPDQLITVVSGVKRYPLWRMVLGFFLGRLPYFSLLAFAGVANRESLEGAGRAVMNLFGI